MIQLALSVGAVIGTIVNPFADKLYLRSARKNKENPGKPIPEARLYSAVPGSLIFTVGLFWYGWSSYPHVHWIVPTLGIGLVGLGIYSICECWMGEVEADEIDMATGQYGVNDQEVTDR
jgi:hypothetical protein